MERVIIAGSGPAGLTAAIYTARANLQPLVIEGILPGGQLTTTTEVENFPGFPNGMDGTALVMEMRKQAERFGTRFVMGEAVSSDLSGKPLKLTMDDGKVLETTALIIATGASAKYLGIESEQKLRGRGVSACATCDGSFYKKVPVAVVGGGDTAMEEALFLTRFASRVFLIHRRDAFRASKIMSDRVIHHEKIEILWNSTITEVHDVAKNEVTGVIVKNLVTGKTTNLPVKGLFLAIGHTPNSAAFKQYLRTDDVGYIITNGVRTDIAGVFAAGDVQDKVFRQAVSAAGTGCMAAIEAERYLESLGQ